MHCRSCGYALWHLSQPDCPECGQAYDLRSYRFEPGTVAFACPHCEAMHAGEGPDHLPTQSDSAQCQGCGEAMDVRWMRVVPLTDPPTNAVSDEMPWDKVGKIGVLRAWWRTFILSLVNPVRLANNTRPDSSFMLSWGFAMLSYFIGAVLQSLFIGGVALVVWLIYLSSRPQGSGSAVITSGGLVQAAITVGVVLLMVCITVVITPLVTGLFLALPAHLFLVVFERDRQPFRVTARSMNYAQGPMALIGIPVVGLYCNFIFQIWTTVAGILLLKESHRIGGGKATAAMLWLPVGLLMIYLLLVALAISGVLFGGPGVAPVSPGPTFPGPAPTPAPPPFPATP